jgi:uncharacterized protein YbcI
MEAGESPVRAPGPQRKGELLEQISNSIVHLHSESFGRGPTGAKTYVMDDLVFCVLRDGLTAVERTLRDQGQGEFVREMRVRFQDAVEDQMRGMVEELTGRHVVAFLSQANVDPELTIEVFFLDGPTGTNGSHGARRREGVPPSNRPIQGEAT